MNKNADLIVTDQMVEKSPDLSNQVQPSTITPAASPLLDALSSAKVGRQQSSTAGESTKSGTGYSSSPSNLISFGDGPDTQPSSYDERVPHFIADTRAQRGITNGYHAQSASPPAPDRRRPLSYTPLNGYNLSAYDPRSQVSPPPGNRRASMYSPSNRYSPHPPPHHPQAHFYGTPELNLFPSPQQNGLQPGSGGYFCGFDKLPNHSSHSGENVIMTGYSCGLKIHSVSKRGTHQVCDIKNLRGGVFDARILPWTISTTDAKASTLVALIIHGPAQKDAFDRNEGRGEEERKSDDTTRSPRLVALDQEYGEDDLYQTTLEIFTAFSGQHVATLLALPRRPLVVQPGSPLFDTPRPDGALSIRADGGYLVVSSGISGEVWVYKYHFLQNLWRFSCIGKVWTTIQQNLTTDSTPVPERRHVNEGGKFQQNQNVPILAHRGRYLAFCPATLSSHVALGADVAVSTNNNRIPGLSTRAPPQLPPVNCQVETPGDESMVKQMLQVGTQKFIEGATYLGGQGMQAWNNYWNKPTSGQSPPNSLPSVQNPAVPFPPTHGSSVPVPSTIKDPGLLSLLDLDDLAFKAAQAGSSIYPLATFKVPHGCSFASFAPSGLALFTASSKGDTQFVWDLMRIQYLKSSFLKDANTTTDLQSQHVRQVAKFSRMTIARIVDVVWASPHGERAAMVTEPGTVHVLDLPANAFNWPPPVRKIVPARVEEEAVDLTSNAKAIVSTAGSAVSSVLAANPFSRRRRSTAGTSAMTVAQAGQTTQALAVGFSRSVGAATGRMNELRKSGMAKLHLPASSTTPSHGCMAFIRSTKKDSVLLTANGTVRIYSIKTRRVDRPADKQNSSKGAKVIEFRLPALPVPQKRPLSMQYMDDLQLTEGDLEPNYKPSMVEVPRRQSSGGIASTIAKAELESNAPFQPFHTDHRRIALYVYSNNDVSDSTSLSSLITPLNVVPPTSKHRAQTSEPRSKFLAFGLPISATRVDTGAHQADEDLDSSRGPSSSVIERILKEDGEEIVITTRRRRGVHRSGSDDVEGPDDEEWSILDIARQQV